MSQLPLLRFIPFRKIDIAHMCLTAGQLDDRQRQQLIRAGEIIEAHFHEDIHRLKERLKDAYGPLDPDAVTRTVHFEEDEGGESADMAARLEEVLQRANYEKVSPEALQRAFASQSLFHVQLYVDMDDFEEVLLYYRGASREQEEVKTWFGLKKKLVQFTKLERVMLYIRFKSDIDVDSTLGGCRPDSTMLKLFQNVPDADIEMLFPNTRVGMRLLDKIMIGVPAVVSGGVVLTTKIGATLVLVGSLLGFWLGLHSEPVELDRTKVLALFAALGTLIGYFWKQFRSIRNRQLKYTQALTRNLYFKLLDNNAGVLYRILDEAEESECKESLLAYSFLLQADEALTARDLDARIEDWLAERWQCRLDFEVADALNKLQGLQLAYCENGLWRPAISGPEV